MPSRRRFVEDLLLAGCAGAAGLASISLRAAGSGPRRELSGSQFDLEIGAMPVDITGARRVATVVNGSLPAPLLRWREGETVTLNVRNRLDVASSIHWHGIVLPADMDGVPGLSFMGIAPGESYRYRFTPMQSGTYWYHSHSRFQEQTGLYGPIVIEPRDGERFPADREHVILLSDWSDIDPERIFATLKKQSDAYNFDRRTLGDLVHDIASQGIHRTFAQRRMWNEMRMDPTDLADVTGHVYTYLMNGVTPGGNWTGLFARGERVRLRFINGSSMSFFDIRIPGLEMTVVAVDGQDVEPVTVDEFRLGTAETCDVIVRPADDRAYTMFAQSMDRSGYARGTLAPRFGLDAEVPALDPRPLLTMRDMMGTMSHAGGMTNVRAHGSHMTGHREAMRMPTKTIETDVGVDMTVSMPRTNLDDPGVGLRDNGRRVLTYADLRTIGDPITEHVDREIELHLTGNMKRYMWSFDGTRFSSAEPIRLRHGERVRFTLVNDTMMTHPIHLHGMWSEVESPGGEFRFRKHTVVVQPAQSVRYRVSADAIGRWAYHCHLLYHMEAGMFREVVVA